MDPIRQITELIEPSVRDLGFEIVRVLTTGGQRPTLQIMVEPIGGGPLTVDHCARISHAVSALLDVADPIAGTYRLEVSSPGIDRPLTRPKDFERYAGFVVRLETRQPVDGRRRFRGRLKGLKDGIVSIATDDGDAAVPLDAVVKAQLVLTDDLIAAGAPVRLTN